jgi:hypothetical protein
LKREKRKGKEKEKDKAKEKEAQSKDEEEDKQDEKIKDDTVCGRSNSNLQNSHKTSRLRNFQKQKSSLRLNSVPAYTISTS